MAKSRRPKTKTNPTDMPTDNPEAAAEALAAANQPVEETPAELEIPVIEEAPPVAETPSYEPSVTVPKDALHAVLSKRKVASIDDAMWSTALEAVQAGKLVLVNPEPPFINIKDEDFNAGAPSPAGVEPINVLNNLVAGML